MKRSGTSTFKQMKLEEISKIVQELEHKLGSFEKGGATIARGGDIFIRPATKDQPKQLLQVKKVLNGSIDVSCSLPQSHTSQRVIIRQVPTGDTDEEILQTLKRSGYKVINAYRFSSMKGTEKIPSTTVALEFEGQYLEEILLNNLVFLPERQLPPPLRCKNCQKLGHTEPFCNTTQACTNCGKNHSDTANCTSTPRCVNCSGEHPASSPSCPKYMQMRAISMTAAEKGVTLQEARLQTFSDAAKKNPSPTEPDPETEILKSQMQALQTEMSRMRTEIGKIKALEKKVENLDSTVNQVQTSLSTLEKGQTSTKSKLDTLVGLFTQNLPNIEEDGMEVEAEDVASLPGSLHGRSSPTCQSPSGNHSSQPKSSGYGQQKRPGKGCNRAALHKK